MMTPEQIAIKEQINEKNARIRTLGHWESDKALEIQALIRQQSVLFDEVIELEVALAVQKSKDTKMQAGARR